MRKNFRAQRWNALGTACALGLATLGCEADTTESAQGARLDGGAAMASPTAEGEVLAAVLSEPQTWRASLSSPGGPLTFGIDFVDDEGALRAVLVNGVERRPAGLVQACDEGLEFAIPPYQSRIVASIEPDGSALVGRWERDRGEGMKPTLPFAAIRAEGSRSLPEVSAANAAAMSGRWAVDFADDEEVAVGVFRVEASGVASGTFLTTLGDYRYLSGISDGRSILLSCFDGAHAFLFSATLDEGGALQGDFWSRDSYHDTWTAVKDASASLPDDFELTEWTGGVPLEQVRFPDASGTVRSLDDGDLRADARLLVVFGTWCPNCNDLTEYLVELDARYPGLGIVGIAFEMGDDPEIHQRAVTDYAAHHGATYPILIGGNASKKTASDAFPLVDRVRAYPTTVFMDREGNVSAVHTGFSGPATGAAHEALKLRFESTIESLLAGD